MEDDAINAKLKHLGGSIDAVRDDVRELKTDVKDLRGDVDTLRVEGTERGANIIHFSAQPNRLFSPQL